MHVVGVSSQAAGHKTLVPQLIEELRKQGADDIARRGRRRDPRAGLRRSCYDAGVAAIFGPGTNIAAPRRRSWRWCGSAAPTHDGHRLSSLAAVRAGDRRALAQAITLVESTRARSPRRGRGAARRRCCPTPAARSASASAARRARASRRSSRRSACTSSTPGHRVAVLAVDPSSTRSGGSILGDKTRMEQLSRRPERVHPPVADGRHARRRRPAHPRGDAGVRGRRLRRRAGRDRRRRPVGGRGRRHGRPVPAALAPGAGDELQGIKRGIIELADLVVVNKADGDLADRRRAHTAADYAHALHLVRPRTAGVDRPRAARARRSLGDGIAEVWDTVAEFRRRRAPDELAGRRAEQARQWMWSEVTDVAARRAARRRRRRRARRRARGGGRGRDHHADRGRPGRPRRAFLRSRPPPDARSEGHSAADDGSRIGPDGSDRPRVNGRESQEGSSSQRPAPGRSSSWRRLDAGRRPPGRAHRRPGDRAPRAQRGPVPGHGARLERHHGGRRPARPARLREPGDRADPRARHRAADRHDVFDLIHPDDRDARGEAFHDVIEHGQGGRPGRVPAAPRRRQRGAWSRWSATNLLDDPSVAGHRDQRPRPHRPSARRSRTARGPGAVPQRVRARADRHGAHVARRTAVPSQPRARRDPRTRSEHELLASSMLELSHPDDRRPASRAGAAAPRRRDPERPARAALRAPRRPPGVGGDERVARARRRGPAAVLRLPDGRHHRTARPAARPSRTRRSTTRSPACPTGCCSSSGSGVSSRGAEQRTERDRGAVPRPRPLQGRERQPRSLRRRPPARGGRRPAERGDADRPTSSPASVATSSWCCARTSSSEETVELIAERIAEAIARPVALVEGEVFVTASIGIALSGGGADTPETLLRNADAAMYRAKERGRDRAELFDARDAPPRGRRPAHRQRAAPRARARRAARALPADGRPRHRHARRLRGADPLGAPRTRAGGARSSSSRSPRRPA